MSIDPEAKTGTITFDLLNTTKAEIDEQFAAVQAFRDKSWGAKHTKRKTTQQPELVYAIFKARQHGKSFREIYEAYESGNLAGYKGSSTQYGNEEALERFYRRYEP